MKKSFAGFALVIAVTIILFSFMAGCRNRSAAGNDEDVDTSSYRPVPTPGTEFEQKLKLVRDAHFRHVWIFERNDGRAFTPEDSQILHTNAPRVVDWVGMEDKKKFIAGSNFEIAPATMASLRKRFKIEDYTGK
jgi:hypothetical protein